MRFFAALSVFAVHTQAIPHLYEAGRSGVCFFFVLSGFVLAWSARDGDRPRRFWRRRAARILPAYAVAWVVGVFYEAHRNGAHVMQWLDVVPGFFLMQAWFVKGSIHFGGDGVAWSLSCEALFYLCFPLVHRLTTKLRDAALIGLLVGVLSASILIPAIAHSENPDYYWAYVFPPTRMLEFVAGIAIAILARRGYRSPVPLSWAIVVTVAAYVAACRGPVWSGQVGIMVVPYALLIASAATDELNPKTTVNWLRSRMLMTLGAWSYSFYLVHQLVNTFVAQHTHFSRHAQVGLTLLLSIACAALLYKLVEHPMERRFRASAPRHRAPSESGELDQTAAVA